MLTGCSLEMQGKNDTNDSKDNSEVSVQKEAEKEKEESSSKETSNNTETPKPEKTFTEEELRSKAEISLAVQLSIEYSDRYDVNRSGYRIDSITETSSGWLVSGTLVLYDYRGNPKVGSFTVRFVNGKSTGSCEIYI